MAQTARPPAPPAAPVAPPDHAQIPRSITAVSVEQPAIHHAAHSSAPSADNQNFPADWGSESDGAAQRHCDATAHLQAAPSPARHLSPAPDQPVHNDAHSRRPPPAAVRPAATPRPDAAAAFATTTDSHRPVAQITQTRPMTAATPPNSTADDASTSHSSHFAQTAPPASPAALDATAAHPLLRSLPESLPDHDRNAAARSDSPSLALSMDDRALSASAQRPAVPLFSALPATVAHTTAMDRLVPVPPARQAAPADLASGNHLAAAPTWAMGDLATTRHESSAHEVSAAAVFRSQRPAPCAQHLPPPSAAPAASRSAPPAAPSAAPTPLVRP